MGEIGKLRAVPLGTASVVGVVLAASAASAQANWRQHAMERPRPEVVEPAEQSLPAPAPQDATVLFDGTDLAQWESVEGGPAPWRVEGDTFVVEPGTGAIQTSEGFGDVQLHLEWSAPDEVAGESQGRGNSGVFLMGQYEVQILDSFDNESYADGQAAALYGQYPPLANAMRGPDEWNAYDIFFRRPRFGEAGGLEEPARVTVLHNGILVQNNEVLWGVTNWLQASPYAAHPDALPIMLQDHGNLVQFRNVWVRPIEERPQPEMAETAETAETASVEMTPEQLDRFVGRYEREPGQYTILRRQGDRLVANVIGHDLELVPVSDSEFAFERTDAMLTFDMDDAGNPQSLVMRLGGVEYPATRVAEAN